MFRELPSLRFLLIFSLSFLTYLSFEYSFLKIGILFVLGFVLVKNEIKLSYFLLGLIGVFFWLSLSVETLNIRSESDLFIVERITKNSNKKFEFITKKHPRKIFQFKQNGYGDFQIFRGDIIQYSGAFSPPTYPKSLTEFNYSKYLSSIGVDSIGKEFDHVVVLNRQKNLFYYSELAKRWLVLQLIKNKFLDEESKSLLIALLTGEKSFLSKENKNLYRDAGVVHVLAISGMHVGIVYGVLVLLFRIFRFSKTSALIAISLSLIFYAFVTGLSPSVVRAVLMFVFLQIGIRIGAKSTSLNYVIVAGLFMLMYDSSLIYDIGFQLSFSAVIGILLTLKRLRAVKLKGWLNNILILAKVNVGAFLFTFPLLSFHFGVINFSSLWMSFFIVPLITLILYQAIILLLIPLFIEIQSVIINYVVGFTHELLMFGIHYKIDNWLLSLSTINLLICFCLLFSWGIRSSKLLGVGIVILLISAFYQQPIKVEVLQKNSNQLELKIHNDIYLMRKGDRMLLNKNEANLTSIEYALQKENDRKKDSIYSENSSFFLLISIGGKKDSISVDKYLSFNLDI